MPRTIAFFNGFTYATGGELWETDGTAAATGLLTEIVPGAAGSNPSGFAPAGTGAVVFTASDGGANGTQVFASNGTAAGTAELNKSFVLLPSGYEPLSGATSLGNGRAVFFGATDPNSQQLWSTDSTAAGTVPLRTFAGKPTPVSTITSNGTGLTAIGNGRALFEIENNTPDFGLWTTDGTAAGTVQLQPGDLARIFTPLGNGTAAITVRDGHYGSFLQVTDGTGAGTTTLHDFLTVDSITAIGNGRALLSAWDPAGSQAETWFTDGTAAGTIRLVQSSVPTRPYRQGVGASEVTPLGDGRAVFAATSGDANQGLWVTDGTVAGTKLLQELGPPNNSTYSVTWATTIGSNRAILKVTDSATNNTALLVTDGTTAGTAELQGFAPAGTQPALKAAVTLADGAAVFTVLTAQAGVQVWRTDGTVAGTVQIAQTAAGSAQSSPGLTALPDGRALFTVINPGGATVLWAMGGTAAGTGQIGSIYVGNSTFGLATVADLDPLFDSDFYNANNPDVAAAGVNAYQHYLANGGIEGRNPDPLFDGKLYLARNPDVAAAGVNPLTHFEQYGWKEGRDPSLLFSDAKYLAANPDVAAAGIDPLLHYELYGRSEGRMTFLSGGVEGADPLVQAAYYDPQLGATLIPTGLPAAQQAAWSYDTSGWQAGLNPDPLFNTAYYLQHNPDVAAAHVNPLVHYEQYGWKEGRDPSAAFSTDKYLAANPDVAAAGVDPLLHYVAYGQAEGRAIYPA